MTITQAIKDRVVELRDEGVSYEGITSAIYIQHSTKLTAEAVRHLYRRNKGTTTPAPKTVKPKPVAKPAPRMQSPSLPSDNSRILVISDMHVPYQHPDTVAFLTALKAKYQPTKVVCIGDEVDYHAMSFHDSDPDLMSAGDELQKAIKELQPIYKLFPNVSLVDSNHGSMSYRKGKANGVPRKLLREYGEVLEAPTGWTWTHDLTLQLPDGNKVYFHHGLSKDVMKVVALRGLCVVQGHYHTEFRIGYIGNPAALLWGMNGGCLIDPPALAFAYDRNNLGRPVIGMSVIIDSQPKLLPMVLNKGGRWNKVVP